ncbi:hypothetical protein BpHYR1_001878 [Brachionus plicatilis]|uniref:Uncharacterized protein n=1 Tax=Brachionus plicatilis TaxID=10195 RepID=A0A3M7RU13_BRAPC|nr:hypothetical protein BpHYR1_001878 [Brachionus plicatilis]
MADENYLLDKKQNEESLSKILNEKTDDKLPDNIKSILESLNRIEKMIDELDINNQINLDEIKMGLEKRIDRLEKSHHRVLEKHNENKKFILYVDSRLTKVENAMVEVANTQQEIVFSKQTSFKVAKDKTHHDYSTIIIQQDTADNTQQQDCIEIYETFESFINILLSDPSEEFHE